MKPAAWAAAITTVAGVAAQFGWWHALGATAVLLVTWAVVNVIKNQTWMRAQNGHEVAREKAHRSADSIIVAMAAAIGTEAARDLALEASSILDDMAGAGATADELMRTARSLARQFPSQLLDRGRSDVVAPDVPSASRPRPGVRASVWTVQSKLGDLAALKSPIRRAMVRRVKVHRRSWRRRGDAVTLWLAFSSPVGEDEVFSAIGSSPLVSKVSPTTAAAPGVGPRAAG